LHAGKGHDSDAVRRMVEARGSMPDIPPTANRIWKSCFSCNLYRDRNAIERMFRRLEDFMRIATRCDRLFLVMRRDRGSRWLGIESIQNHERDRVQGVGARLRHEAASRFSAWP